LVEEGVRTIVILLVMGHHHHHRPRSSHYLHQRNFQTCFTFSFSSCLTS